MSLDQIHLMQQMAAQQAQGGAMPNPLDALQTLGEIPALLMQIEKNTAQTNITLADMAETLRKSADAIDELANKSPLQMLTRR